MLNDKINDWLYDWVFRFNHVEVDRTPHSNFLNKAYTLYPFEGGKIYRGYHFETKSEYDSFLEFLGADTKNITFTTKMCTAWTTDMSMAVSFASERKIAISMFDKKPSKLYGGVVLESKITRSAKAIDITKAQDYFKEVGGWVYKENEVIVPPSVITVSVNKLVVL